MLSCSECNLDLHIPQKREDWKFFFFFEMENEKLVFIFKNNCSLISYQQIQCDSVSDI